MSNSAEAADPDRSRELTAIEAEAFFYTVFEHLGYDFRHYSDASRNRRLLAFVDKHALGTISEAQGRILRDPTLLASFLSTMTVNVTEMFRDPLVFAKIRTELLPRLATYPSIRIWIAGCATGEEAYSMAILLDEAGLLDRTTIYATDIDSDSLRIAASAIYPADAMVGATRNYQVSGGERPFSDWYIAKYDRCILSPALRSHLEFFSHNLATDSAFGEFHLIMCRNVFIYFEEALQQRVERIFAESLTPFGNLAIGPREGLTADGARLFKPLDRRLGIYVKSQNQHARV
ncbi:chemotaxis protein methyltransferase CheR [Mycolicibacterium sp. BK556]|uniref:CheR family methyltransferase n=1 Tax=Mycobacteriaceae TaxID=1762 RepID=UPI00105E25AC|nr:protein-glutamate O-methyltransferase CheR [Mycobacterium sp. BK086]MBB3601126.1 chemotaxis protein methyltransferase CheR [Mycolicibacterium sp. BK556]MBB3630880.1 chemotaxis protein methyltransferase CheR [Mycolicibacterium sp. BK607]MBB3748876.1 chemotaxis protein methyltransferase CheR [Mycolicibacterium sp. BK634]